MHAAVGMRPIRPAAGNLGSYPGLMALSGPLAGPGFDPMIGFDADAVAREFGLAEDDVPVMLLSVRGEACAGRRSRAVR